MGEPVCSYSEREDRIQVLADAMAAGRLTDDQATLLTYIMEALYDYDELDTFIDEHAEAFESYVRGGEQRLEWTQLHMRYVSMVETHIAEQLQDLGTGGGDAEALYAILEVATENDSRAQAFLSRLLSMGDYDFFASEMQRGGGWLKVSLDDLRQLGGEYADPDGGGSGGEEEAAGQVAACAGNQADLDAIAAYEARLAADDGADEDEFQEFQVAGGVG